MLAWTLPTMAQDPTTDKKPLLTIGCLSDLHSELALINPASGKVEDVKLRGTIINTLQKMYEEEDLDLIVLGGDCTSDVTIPKENWERVRDLMHEAFRGAFRPGRTRRPVIYVTGNHDYEVANFDAIPKAYNAADYLPIMEEDIAKLAESEKFYENADNGSQGTMRLLAAFHYVINGFDFVMLNCGKHFFQSAWNYNYSHESVAWVDQKLDEIYAENPNKTVFFVLHLPFGDSNSISAYGKGLDCRNTNNSAYALKQALAKHPNLIMLYGHDHGTNSAFIRSRTSQRVTRYDCKGNVIDTFDETHQDFVNGDEPIEPIDVTAAYYIQSVPTSEYLCYDSSNNIETQPTESSCTVTISGGTLTINTAANRDIHIGSNGRFSGGTASAITLYRVADPEAATFTATKSTEIEAGAVYLITALYNGSPYAMSNQLYNKDTGDNQRMQSTKITVSGDVASVASDANLLWTFTTVESAPQGGTTDLTSGTFTLWNEGNSQYLDIDSYNLCTSSNPMPCTFSTNSNSFVIDLSTGRLYIGSSGRFSRNTDPVSDSQRFQLYKVEDLESSMMTATKVSTFDVNSHYLIVGIKSGKYYALTNQLYSGGSSSQRVVGKEVTISDDAISMTTDKSIIWTIREVPPVEPGDPSFLSAFMGSMRYYDNSIEGDVSVSNSKIVQALMVYVYDDHIFLQLKNYGQSGTFNGITIRKDLLPYVIYRNVEFSTDTGIDTRITATDAPKDIYDLAGRRVQEAHRGVFIMDHHKVLVR